MSDDNQPFGALVLGEDRPDPIPYTVTFEQRNDTIEITSGSDTVRRHMPTGGADQAVTIQYLAPPAISQDIHAALEALMRSQGFIYQARFHEHYADHIWVMERYERTVYPKGPPANGLTDGSPRIEAPKFTDEEQKEWDEWDYHEYGDWSSDSDG
jgi:hypothetical protein